MGLGSGGSVDLWGGLGLLFRFLGSFSRFLTRLKSSCIFVAIFADLSLIFGGLGRVLNRILGGFFD